MTDPSRRHGKGSGEGEGFSTFSEEELALLMNTECPEEILGFVGEILHRSSLMGAERLDVLQELLAHFEDGLASGHSPSDLMDAFGDAGQTADLIRRAKSGWGWSKVKARHPGLSQAMEFLEGHVQDLSLAFRGLKRTPGFTLLAITTLALGIGATTAIFSVVNGVLLEALPYHDHERLVVPVLTKPEENVRRGQVGYADFLRWREVTGVFQDMGLYLDWNVNLTGGDYPERIKGAVVSNRYFDVLAAAPILGRTFAPEEHERGGEKVALLSRSLWAGRFGSDPGIIGTPLVLDGESYRVVGVMPPEAQWPKDAEVFLPLTFGAETPDWVLEMDAHAYSVVGRLQPGIELSQASVAVDQIAQRAAAERPDTRAGFGATAIPLRTYLVGESAERTLWLLLASVGLLLLIACANVASLTLERALGRRKEIAIRASIGADRIRSVRPLAWEALVVAMVGGGLGVGISVCGTRILAAGAPWSLPGLANLPVDYRLLGFGLVVSLGTGLVFSLVPAFTARRLDLRQILTEGGSRTGHGGVSGRVRTTLVVTQLGLSVVLVLGATLVVKSTYRLLRSDPGFRPEQVLTMKAFVPHGPPDAQEDLHLTELYGQFTDRLEALPGVSSASLVSALPLSADGLFDYLPFQTEEEVASSGRQEHFGNWNVIGPGFFRTLGIEVLRGRGFSRSDGAGGLPVVVLSESLAQEMFPEVNPIGRRIRSSSPVVADTLMEVVGVAADVRYIDLTDQGRNVVYVPHAQSAWRAMALAVRFQGDPGGRNDEVRQALWEVDPNVPFTEVRSMEELISRAVAHRRFVTTLVTAFAFLALTLGSIGVYSVVTVSLRRRRHEFGIRLALGAEPGEIRRDLMNQGVRLALMGIAVGLPAGLLLMKLTSGLLYDVQAGDPLVWVLVPLFLGLTSVGSTVRPALKASSIDPLQALTEE